MKPKFAEFWVCAEPEEITRTLHLEPTSITTEPPHSYWRLECSGEEYGVDCIAALLKILETRETEIIEVMSKYAVGVLWVQIIEPDQHNCDHNFHIEAEEMALLARLKVPLCAQAWLNDR